MTIHFISGLPRSGSTLLAAILRQNPRFRAGMTSPVAMVFRAIEDATAGNREGSAFITDAQRDAMLRGVFSSFYDCHSDVVFDTSRMWCARLPVIARLFPRSKVIACVRDVGWILDSFESLYRRNGMKSSGLFGWDMGGTVWSRMSALAAPNGVVGFAINALQEAVASTEAAGRLMLVDYDDLCADPDGTLVDIYELIGEPHFLHDYENVSYEAGEFDRLLGADGLHTVHGRVQAKPRKSILPLRLFAELNGPNFWKNSAAHESASC